MHPARPQAPPVPCPVCGRSVDPLRAREVILLEDGFRYLCDAACRDRFHHGDRTQRGPARRTPRAMPEVQATTHATAARDAIPTPAGTASSQPAQERAAEPALWVGVGLTTIALLLGIFPGPLPLEVLSALASCGVAAVTLHLSRNLRDEMGWLPWLLGPLGVILAATAALGARMEDPLAWGGLLGAAVAAGAVLARAWLDRHAAEPVQEAIDRLRAPIPATVAVPDEDASEPLDLAVRRVSTADVRTGEQVLALEGEVVAVDGVVQAGDAFALLHPGAQAPVRRRPGDPLLAGARIVEGDVRLLVTRVGEDRGLMRPALFRQGAGPTREPAPLGRLGARLVHWAGLATAAGAVVGLGAQVAAGVEGLAAPLTAAAAVLIAAPLIAVRRSAETPWVAAGAAAGERGIIYASARAVDAAARTTVVALCTRGTVTEGVPEVVEIQQVDEESSPDRILALIAGAQATVDHPLATAIRRYAETRQVPPEPMRRASFTPGRGVTALGPQGEVVVVGHRQLLLEEGISVAIADDEATHAEERGHTVLFAAVDERVRALVILQDEVRFGARAAIQRLYDLDMEVVLVSGDHRVTVEALASQLDVSHVRAELLPEERSAEMRRLREHGGPVAAVGRAEDEIALSGADVPIVLRGAGSPAGERGVGVATDDLRDATAALWMARAARTEAWRTTSASMVGGALLVAGAAVGWLAPGVVGLLAVALDGWALPAGARLLRRISLRIPSRS
jgi:P-type Cu+ transporter